MTKLEQLITELRALPRFVEKEVETGIGMFPETVEADDGPFLKHEDVAAVLARYDNDSTA